MKDWQQRIHLVLGDDSERSEENALRYLAYLRTALKFPVRVTGREDFQWEERYVLGGWSQSEYAHLKKTNPSFTDIFDLIELLPPGSDADVTAKISRISDKRTFMIGLYWLTTTTEDDKNFQTLDDYATWHANY